MARLSTIDRGTGESASALEILTTGTGNLAAQRASSAVLSAAMMPSPFQPTICRIETEFDSGAMMYVQRRWCSVA